MFLNGNLSFVGIFTRFRKSTDSDIAEKRLLASRAATAIFLTGCAHGGFPYFKRAFDALSSNSWKELGAWIAEPCNGLVLACAWFGSGVETNDGVEAFRKLCSATHNAAYKEWPIAKDAPFRARSALAPGDAQLAQAMAKIDDSKLPAIEMLLASALDVLAPEFLRANVKPMDAEDLEDGALFFDALTDLLRVEWILWGAGHDEDAGRVNIARALVGAASMSYWTDPPCEFAPAMSAAVVGLEFLRGARF